MEQIDYWRLKSQIAEITIEEMQVKQILEARKIQIMKENGLNPDKKYRFIDETFTVEEITQ